MSERGSYDPRQVEADIYRFWEQGGYFHAEPDPQRQPYVIDIPLPNVTGALHLGHALNNTVQDILIRYKRMCGFNAMWMPGTDHAGIATQAVVERKLKEEQNLTRHDLGRDGLVRKIWEWKEKYGGLILEQLRRLGCSLDWPRTRFTLDEVCARAVYEAFFQWFKAGLIYRGTRLVNWDAYLQTAVADDEIIYATVKGNLWHYRYPILRTATELPEKALSRAVRSDAVPGRDYLVIATTRPETMLGDTAVAVHPDDERYRHLVGRQCLLPLMNRSIPIIADAILVKREFGTGCVKVTPGHDPNDYAFAQRHGVPMINILTRDARINENGGPYAGLDRYEARQRIVQDLEKLGLMEKIEPYETQIGHSDRSKTPIEPMLSEQWFVRMADLAEAAIEAVRDGRVRFFPERYAKTYIDWLSEKRDWCISRQLWWGHRIPVWTFPDATQLAERRPELLRLQELIDQGRIVCRTIGDNRQVSRLAEFVDQQAASDRSARLAFCPRADFLAEFEKLADGLGLQRDEDVLDTWFSSALWPFSTLGWPHEADGVGANRPNWPSRADFEYFYPTSTLVTARGIITLWVARMVMTGLYFTGRVPFQHVHIHPVILDGQGRIMSKSLGNGVDPLDIIELYGTDALRFVMAQMDTETQDVRMPVKPVRLPDGRTVNSSEKFEIGRNFCNKIWQAATGFVLPNLAAGSAAGWPRPLLARELALEDHWILSRLSRTISDIDRRFERYQISEIATTLYNFFWGEFCDWYIELVKPRLYDEKGGPATRPHAQVARQVLAWVLDQLLRLLHPVMPFITEAVWQKLNEVAPRRGVTRIVDAEPALIKAAWPDAGAWLVDSEAESQMGAVQSVIRGLRDTLAWINAARSASRQPALGRLPRAVIRADAELLATLVEQKAAISRLGRCEQVEMGPEVAKPAGSATKVFAGIEVFVPVEGLADLAAERQRLSRQRDELGSYIRSLEAKLASADFVSKAPPAVVERERDRLGQLKEKLAALERHAAELPV